MLLITINCFFILFTDICPPEMLTPFFHKNLIEAGLDEAGRGCFAGPVFAAAVILPKDFFHPLLNDSKQLNEKQRDELRPWLKKKVLLLLWRLLIMIP